MQGVAKVGAGASSFRRAKSPIVAGTRTSRVRWPVPATGLLEVGAQQISECARAGHCPICPGRERVWRSASPCPSPCLCSRGSCSASSSGSASSASASSAVRLGGRCLRGCSRRRSPVWWPCAGRAWGASRAACPSRSTDISRGGAAKPCGLLRNSLARRAR